MCQRVSLRSMLKMPVTRDTVLIATAAAGIGALAAYAFSRPRAARLATHAAPAAGLPSKTAAEEAAASELKARIRAHYDGCSPH